MMDALALFMWHRTFDETAHRRNETRIPEPEFKPFQFPEKKAVAARDIAPANATREPMTLEALGVPPPLAHEMEATLRVMGAIRGDRVMGYTFRTPDGTSYELRVSNAAERNEVDLAA